MSEVPLYQAEAKKEKAVRAAEKADKKKAASDSKVYEP